MKVKTHSEQPHLRPAGTPYTAMTISVDTSARNSDKQKELEFLSILVQALDPRVGLQKVNQALAQAIGGGLDFEGTERK